MHSTQCLIPLIRLRDTIKSREQNVKTSSLTFPSSLTGLYVYIRREGILLLEQINPLLEMRSLLAKRQYQQIFKSRENYLWVKSRNKKQRRDKKRIFAQK